MTNFAHLFFRFTKLNNHIMLDSNLGNNTYLSPAVNVITLLSHQVLCTSGDFNGIDTEIDENPDNWL